METKRARHVDAQQGVRASLNSDGPVEEIVKGGPRSSENLVGNLTIYARVPWTCWKSALA